MTMAASSAGTRTAVRNLYKQILWAGKDYPGGFDNLRNGAKKAFFAMKEEKDPEKIQQAIARGEYVVKELEAMAALHKYRTLKKAYSVDRQSIPGYTATDLEQK